MASTNIKNDPGRIKKQLEIMTGPSRWTMNVPGNGLDLPFITDPNIRMQEWGSNFATNFVDIDNNLKGLGRNLTKECMSSQYKNIDIKSKSYPNKSFNVNTTSISNPAFNLRDSVNHRAFSITDDNHNNFYEIPFNTDLGTRMYEKDINCGKI